ncbi:uncharacterized protein LOC108679623 isoform X2 [Hyalella azteca]|uniref:Uncharacterized protein LOC108679623 isoform X2 n=1 Tax=Hyalella azteca TaxID=294128 RepID=A0A8B7PEP2_HYAAZ|nr:uncharacterized protein LOC108679623 isoform X2 [Hyalella azteca]
MSEGTYSAGGLSRGSFNGSAAPTRPRKRIYDAEVSLDEEVVTRRAVHYSGYESFKDIAPYKKAERMARYSRPRQEGPSASGVGVPLQSGSGVTGSQDPCKSPMMEDEDINQGLADNFEDSLCGLGTDVSSSKYNMREALHALPSVATTIKQESISLRLENISTTVTGPAMYEDSNSIDRILKLLTNDGLQDGVGTNLPQYLAHSAHQGHTSSTFSPSPSEDALGPPSPSPGASHGLQYGGSQISSAKLQSSHSSPELEQKSHEQVILALNHHSSALLREDPIVSGEIDCDARDAGGSSSVGGDAGDDLSLGYDDAYSLPDKHDLQVYDDNRFQYILSVPTSTAVKRSEDTLSYLNQGQPYEIKIKKLGDITKCVGKKFTSFIRICFHERRFQFIEKEQLTQWHQLRPNERIIEIDVPLSYGISEVQQSKHGQAVVRFDWDPNKDVAAYIKVNCISTEFTQRKHGGEKGVPFRIQIETCANIGGQMQRLNVCGCQVKVFKLKGADRKHKQDRDKISKLPLEEREKFQESCECTILTTYIGDAIYAPEERWCSSPESGAGSGPELRQEAAPGIVCSSGSIAVSSTPVTSATTSPVQQRKLLACVGIPAYSGNPAATDFIESHVPGSVLNSALEGDESAVQIQVWLKHHRFSNLAATFANFTATDILRLSRSEIIEICGLADGIRLFNALHAKSVVPRLTLYICSEGETVYSALYLERATYKELVRKLASLFSLEPCAVQDVVWQGPSGIHVKLNDEVVRNFQDECLLMCSAVLSSPSSPPSPDSKAFSLSYTLVLRTQPRPFEGPTPRPALYETPSSRTSLFETSTPRTSHFECVAPRPAHFDTPESTTLSSKCEGMVLRPLSFDLTVSRSPVFCATTSSTGSRPISASSQDFNTPVRQPFPHLTSHVPPQSTTSSQERPYNFSTPGLTTTTTTCTPSSSSCEPVPLSMSNNARMQQSSTSSSSSSSERHVYHLSPPSTSCSRQSPIPCSLGNGTSLSHALQPLHNSLPCSSSAVYLSSSSSCSNSSVPPHHVNTSHFHS